MENDYKKIVEEFGAQPIDKDVLDRIRTLTGKEPHQLLKRGVFYSHRDFNKILDLFEAKKPFYLYTGRGPSSKSMHMGHMIPFMFCKYLQDIFDCPVIIQMTDDEKYLGREIKLEEAINFGRENARDILALGFNREKTFIFSNCEMIKHLYPNVLKIEKLINLNTVSHIFGINKESNIGMVSFPAIQAAPSFSSTFPELFLNNKIPCLIPCAIDQDPYFRMTRDVAGRLKEFKPALIHSKFIPSLLGINAKMSASSPETSIYMSDSVKEIEKKIKRHAFSGGRETSEEHRLLGGDPDIDISYQYLTFLEPCDTRLETVRKEYISGSLSSGQIKQLCINSVSQFILQFQLRRSKITEEELNYIMSLRPLI